jgi:hypothetical protein
MFYIKKGENYRLICRWHVFHICSHGFWEHKQIDDYKMSRAVRIAEIAFAILSQKVRIFYDQNQPSFEDTDTETLSTHVLHICLRNVCNAQDSVFVDKNYTWQSPYVTIFCPLGRNTSEEATTISENTGLPLKMGVSSLETGSREKTRHGILLTKIAFFSRGLLHQSRIKNCLWRTYEQY